MTDYPVSPELQAAVESMREPLETQGFHKLASAMVGFDVADERKLLEHLGTKLAMERLEWRRINKGLTALRSLEK